MKTLNLFILVVLLQLSQITYSQNALDFDGTDDYVQTTYSGISGSSNRTVEAWINTPFILGQEVITDWGSAVTGGRFTFALIDGKLRVEVQGSGYTSTTVVGNSAWHHVAVTFNNSLSTKYKLYIDGVLDGSFNIATPINTVSGTNLRIGIRVDGAKVFSGKIDEVRVWNVERTASQISSNRNIEFCGAQTGLVAYYKFNHGTAAGNNSGINTLTDFSGNSNNGTLSGFSLSGSTSNWVSGASLTQGIGSSSSISVTSCDSYTSPSGNYTWTSTGIYIDTIPNFVGCDSIMTITLTVNNSSTNSISDTACIMYISPSGKQWDSTNTYIDTISSAAGCDSIITINLTIINVDVSVIQNGINLTANAIGASYQWIDCNNGNNPISGATNQVFTAISNGSYAVIVSANNCIDTSICFQITGVGFNNLDINNNIRIFPNPSSSIVNIDLGMVLEFAEIEISDLSGKTILSRDFSNAQNIKMDISEFDKGIYFIRISTDLSINIVKLIVE